MPQIGPKSAFFRLLTFSIIGPEKYDCDKEKFCFRNLEHHYVHALLKKMFDFKNIFLTCRQFDHEKNNRDKNLDLTNTF
jgi:hypothetical protein